MKNSATSFLIFTLSLICFNQASTQKTYYFDDQPPLEIYNAQNSDIADNSAFSMAADQQGYIWMATGRGLVCHNGHDFKTYKIPDSFYRKLLVDNRGWIWIICYTRTDYFLSRFDPITEQFTIIEKERLNFNPKLNFALHQIEEDQFGNIWLTSSQGVRKIKIRAYGLNDIEVTVFNEKTYTTKIDSLLNNLESQKTVAIEEVGNNEVIQQKVSIFEKSKYLIVSTAESSRYLQLMDFGFLTQGEKRIWEMSYRKTMNGGGSGKNRVQIDTLTLEAGKYQLNYVTDENHSFESWNALPPMDTCFWGIRLYKINEEEYQQIENSIHTPNQILSGVGSFGLKAASDGSMWISNIISLDKISFQDENTYHVKTYETDLEGDLSPHVIRYIFEPTPNQIWLTGYCFTKGFVPNRLAVIRNGEEQIIPVKHNLSYTPLNYIRGVLDIEAIVKDSKSNFWMTSSSIGNGVTNFQLPNDFQLTDTIEINVSSLLLPGGIGKYPIKSYQSNSLLLDINGNLWIGTFEWGIGKINATGEPIGYVNIPNNIRQKNQYNKNYALDLNHSHLAILRHNSKNLDTDKGVFNYLFFDEEYNVIKSINQDSPLSNVEFAAGWIIDKTEKLWFGTMKVGNIYSYDPLTKQFETYTSNTKEIFYPIFEDNKGVIWAMNLTGHYYKLDRKEKEFQEINIPSQTASFKRVSSHRGVWKDSKGDFWIHAIGGGLTKFSFSRDTFNYQEYIPQYRTSAIEETSDGRIWIGTMSSELIVYDPMKDTVQKVVTNDELYSNLGWITGIERDDRERLWLYTSKAGIVIYDSKDNTYLKYNKLKELDLEYYRFEPMDYTPEDELIIIQNDGFFLINPNDFDKDTNSVKVVIENVGFTDDTLSINFPSLQYSNLRVPFRNNDININYVGIYYNESAGVRYSYFMEGVNESWINVGKERIARFTDLSPGKYTFRVKAANADGVWAKEEAVLNIQILPPWWRTWWAYTLYGILIGGIVYYAYRFQLKRRLAEAEGERLKELDEFKSQFYTNITHEFRTPLTVILGMNEQQEASRVKQLIRRNAQKLLQLINQLLDLSKLDTGNLKIHYQSIEMVGFTEYISESFQFLAKKKQIQLMTYSDEKSLEMDMDGEKYRQIISNLLSNAVKFTPSEGKIILNLSQEKQSLVVQLKDNGIGISEEELPHIFDRFYQVDRSLNRQEEGTGVGLALVKELVKLLEGNITVDSQVGKRTIFTLVFPIKHTASEKLENFGTTSLERADLESSSLLGETVKEDLPRLLLVEDNPDVIIYIQSLLASEYDVVTANNGAEGIITAIEQVPDIIISDVMMPKKNGFELVEALKQDERTSHIPIILLTAKATQEDKIQGLAYGADAYLMKPFQKEELFIRLRKLIELRANLRKKYQIFDLSTENIEHPDERFLHKIHQLAEQHHSNPDFGIEDYASALSLSRMQLYRKLVALLNKKPSQYILQVRLLKSKHLLEYSAKNISEIAYDVGFNSPTYFARVFKKEFGITPKEYRQQNTKS